MDRVYAFLYLAASTVFFRISLSFTPWKTSLHRRLIAAKPARAHTTRTGK